MRYFNNSLVQVVDGQEMRYIEASCDSTEIKPTVGIVDGSQILETNTGDIYVFNELSGAWVRMFSLKE